MNDNYEQLLDLVNNLLNENQRLQAENEGLKKYLEQLNRLIPLSEIDLNN